MTHNSTRANPKTPPWETPTGRVWDAQCKVAETMADLLLSSCSLQRACKGFIIECPRCGSDFKVSGPPNHHHGTCSSPHCIMWKM